MSRQAGKTRGALKRFLRYFLPVTRRLAMAPQVLLEEMPNHPDLFDQYRFMLESGMKRVRGGWEFENRIYPDYLTVGGTSRAIERTALKYCKGIGLDIGAGYWPLPGSTAIDLARGPGLTRSLGDIPIESQDYVFSAHTLEHIADWKPELNRWVSKLKAGGHLFLYLPHPDCGLWHPRNPYMAQEHKWVPKPDVIAAHLTAVGLLIVDRDDGPDHFYSFFVCARKLA
jgi:hypothetical protein